ncbi:hypothetical protein EV421DRAFT_1744264 [Armillaria borealis]|uniref:Uncharacterized protein n=1 Tax=Armillaria borealis TaxID=47425 RepID=A0AA39ITL0_9AGAR|nr:hypothetical protein EV421DRAFT_1744264 [Armillaria borealis]
MFPGSIHDNDSKPAIFQKFGLKNRGITIVNPLEGRFNAMAHLGETVGNTSKRHAARQMAWYVTLDLLPKSSDGARNWEPTNLQGLLTLDDGQNPNIIICLDIAVCWLDPYNWVDIILPGRLSKLCFAEEWIKPSPIQSISELGLHLSASQQGNLYSSRCNLLALRPTPQNQILALHVSDTAVPSYVNVTAAALVSTDIILSSWRQ